MITLWLAACSALPFLPSVGEAGPDARGVCETDDAPSTCNPEGPPARRPQSVLGEPLAVCSTQPLTGWFRDGTCRTDTADRGLHTVCAQLTDRFLDYTRARGNDLSTARGAFPGLKRGDRWCLCAARWEEARRAGVAPPVVMEATDDAALRIVDGQALADHAVSSGAR